jgi:uncharacterized damage-inducible protein DinB
MEALFAQLIRHLIWADARTLASLKTLAMPDPEATRLFAHVVVAESIYLDRLEGRDPFPQEFWPELTLDEASSVGTEAAERLARFVAGLKSAFLKEPVRYRNSRGVYFETPIEEMVMHVVLHGERHRGQIARLVRAAGGRPAVTDFITFVREEGAGRIL